MTFRAWAVLALCVVLAAAGLGYYSGHKNQQIDKALQQSQELKGKVNALQEQARVAVDQADAAAATAAQHEATAKALKAKLAGLQRQAVPAAPGVPAPVGVVDSDGLRYQIIAAQDQQIAAQKDEIKGLRAALDLKDRALVTAEQRARGLELALEAQKHASKTQRWLGRIEGVAVGIAIGYVGGKLQ